MNRFGAVIRGIGNGERVPCAVRLEAVFYGLTFERKRLPAGFNFLPPGKPWFALFFPFRDVVIELCALGFLPSCVIACLGLFAGTWFDKPRVAQSDGLECIDRVQAVGCHVPQDPVRVPAGLFGSIPVVTQIVSKDVDGFGTRKAKERLITVK